MMSQTESDEFENKLRELGFCPVCMTEPQHHIDEPFSTCDCGTGEDYGNRSLQRLQCLEAQRHRNPDAKL